MRVVKVLAVALGLMFVGPAAGAVDSGFAINPTYPVHQHIAYITIGTTCVDEVTHEAAPASATLTVTLQQGNKVRTKTKLYTCNGYQEILFRFRHFHAGEAEVTVRFIACDENGCSVNGPITVPISLVR